MMKKLTHNTVAAAGLAALFLLGACASNDGLRESDDVVEVRPEQAGQSATVAPAPGPAKVDSDGNIYSSSNAPGMGNPSTVGTNTNVNIVPERSNVTVRTTDTSLTSSSTVDTTVDTTADVAVVETTPVVTTPSVTTTTVETTTVPMTSSVQSTTTTTTDDDDDDTTTTTATTTRTRMRKD